MLKYNSKGELLWSKTLGGEKGERAKDIRILGTSVYISGVSTSYGSGKADALLLKVGISGEGM